MIDLAPAGGPLACVGLAFLFAARGRGVRLAGLGLLVLGGSLLAAALAPSRHAGYLASLCIVAVVVCGILGLVLRRWPWALAFATLALVPARIPVHVGGSGSKLLLPLYLVAGGAAVQLFVETVQGDERSRELGVLGPPLAAFVVWSGLSLTWSSDVGNGGEEILAFYVPFGVLAVVLARLPWSRRALVWLGLQLVAMGILFAAVGFWQYRTRNIFQNPKVIYSNAYAPFFRVNSLFWDPSIYGRFLVLGILVALVVALRGRSLRNGAVAAAAVVVLWLGLLLSFSQTSFAALIVAVLAAAVVAWGRRAGLAVVLVALVVAGLGVASPHVRATLVRHSKQGLNAGTSGRAGLVSTGLRIAVHDPVFGVGVGGFRAAYAARTHLKGKEPKKAASHTTAVTVAAESGFVGLALFAWLVLAPLGAAFRRLGRSFEHQAALALGLAFLAIVAHSFAYADFFEDPTTWGVLGLIALASATLERRARRA